MNKLSDGFLEKLGTNDENLELLKNLMWFQSQIKWEVSLTKYRKKKDDTYDNVEELQKLIELVATHVLEEVKELNKSADKFV